MIREAKPSDAEHVVPLIIQAMGDLAPKFAHAEEPEVINNLFQHFFKLKDNQYSFENTLVYEENENILGSINAYDGAKLAVLREPFLAYLNINSSSDLNDSEQETESGEFYIDTVSVKPEAQGKGIGKLLILAVINRAKELNHHRAGLLVEVNNPGALKLYQNIGFRIKNEKTFMGGKYHHMLFVINE
ncbi:GNAT family N-acetyltransferase [Pedobacter petrophilus]|uniref:GNAT family N-acetyltransferase n=1 Tax=Pedobacter petrophilus TaxID=1908241 RepID=A0A7K0G3A6_9SPHI|nr:GNAT family N-acetyltransferase [Pedobacter petrophilus]MRX78297.1 GNAT family N-acetyltransferase [Pedobacter petrophilus]